MSLVIGFDVSKKKIAKAVYDGKSFCVSEICNSEKEIGALIKRYESKKEDVLMVMEATGTYHLKLATMLHKGGFKVAVLNPLIIKRYSEMKMSRAKTDCFDSKQIARYGFDFREELRLFSPPSEVRRQMIKMLHAIEDFEETISDYRNRLEALSQDPSDNNLVQSGYEKIIKSAENEIKKMRTELDQIIKKHYNNQSKLLQTIPGIGQKTATIIIAFFGDFEDFEISKQVISYCGTNPSPKESGTSVKGRGKISKKGSKYLRKHLYMITLSAARYNKSCRELYLRLKEKGRENKQARIAVVNKIIRQIFAIVKSKKIYDENYSCLFTQR